MMHRFSRLATKLYARIRDAWSEERALVDFIRTICAHELDADYDLDFFYRDYHEGESADDALLRLFRTEKSSGNHESDTEVVLCLLYG